MTTFAYFIGGSQDLTKRVVFDGYPPYHRVPKIQPIPMTVAVTTPEIMDCQTEDYRLLAKYDKGRDTFMVFVVVDDR